jgi:hypothetical protein
MKRIAVIGRNIIWTGCGVTVHGVSVFGGNDRDGHYGSRCTQRVQAGSGLDHARGRDLVGGDAVQRGYADRGASARAEVDRIQTGQVESMFFKELRERGEALSDALVAKALKAYASGRLLLIVNGRQVTGLDADIDLSVPIEALFLRLVPLQGG